MSDERHEWRATSEEEWRELVAAAGLDEVEEHLGTLAEAQELLTALATSFFPLDQADLSHLTWSEQGVVPMTDAAMAGLRFRTLVEQIPAVTFMAVLGEGKNEVYVSPHIEQMLGYSQQEWLEDPFLWYYRLHPEDRALWHAEFAKGCRMGGPFRAECRFLARDGRVVWVHGEARVVKDGLGRPAFLQGVAFDITESKRAQEILVQDAVRTAKQQEEMAIARRVQTSLLPADLTVPGLEIAASMKPAEDVGGDYYDVRPFVGGCWLAVGDVSGHGLNAGLVMMMAQSAMAGILRADKDATPKDVLCTLNDVIYDNVRKRLGSNDHITLTLFRWTPDGKLVFAGAHEDIIIWRKATKKVEMIRPPGTWLGARRDIARFTVDAKVQLAKGDLVVLYTDGVTEAMNEVGEQFNFQRLVALTERLAERPVSEVHDGIVREVEKWTAVQQDDVSVMVLRHQGI